MEHAQRCVLEITLLHNAIVLILILMEHAQRACTLPCRGVHVLQVLILILMEHAQRAL